MIKEFRKFFGNILIKLGVDYRDIIGYCESLLFILKNNKLLRRGPIEFEFSKTFAKYYYSNNYNEKLQKLIENLDDDSKKTVLNVIDRYIYIFHNNVLNIKKVLDYISEDVILENDKIKKDIFKRYHFPILNYEVSVFYYKCGLKFIPKDIIERYKNKSIIDCGAFIGDSAIMFNEILNPSKIYAFEPDDKNYNLLLKTIEKNQLKNIIPIKKGVSNKKDVISFISNGSCSRIVESANSKKIELTTIDDFVSENNINDIGIIKMDIEGHEFEAIEGAINTIKKFKPILLISIYHRGKDFFEIKPLIEDLNLGYKFKIRKLNPFHPTYETMLIAYPKYPKK